MLCLQVQCVECPSLSALAFGDLSWELVITHLKQTLLFTSNQILGIGGDYPLSAVITSEYATVKTRGAMIGAVFAMQVNNTSN